MTFPLYLIFIPYAIGILVYFVLSTVLLYHIVRFGFWDASTRFVVLIFVVGSLLNFSLVAISLWGTDFKQTIAIFGNFEIEFPSL